jgi:hypothetical protein
MIADCEAGRECKHLICEGCRARQIEVFLSSQEMPVLECKACRLGNACVSRGHVEASLVSLSSFFFFLF